MTASSGTDFGLLTQHASRERAMAGENSKEKIHAVRGATGLGTARPVTHLCPDADISAKFHQGGGLIYPVEQSRLVQRGPTLGQGGSGAGWEQRIS
jgi:hypothetical protein